MNGGKETWGSLGRNKTAQFSLTEWFSNCLTQWKRSQNITAKYLWNKMYNNAGTWHEVQAHHKGLYISDLTELKHGSADARQDRSWKTMIDLHRRKYDCMSISNKYACMSVIIIHRAFPSCIQFKAMWAFYFKSILPKKLKARCETYFKILILFLLYENTIILTYCVHFLKRH